MDEYVKIVNEINNLKDSEISEYVDNKLKLLEDSSQDEIIGQGYTDAYRNYIGLKTHYKPILSTSDFSCPDLVYDYKEPYVALVKSIRKNGYSIVSIMNQMFRIVNGYSPLGEITLLNRSLAYIMAEKANKKLSIEALFNVKGAFCSEKSGLVHNMFKFLGIDSELVFGYNDKKAHSYNMVYPYGYGKEPMFLLDVSYFIDFIKDNNKYSLAYLYAMDNDSYDAFVLGKEYRTDLKKMEAYYRHFYNLDDSYRFVGSNKIYTYGLSKNDNIKNK